MTTGLTLREKVLGVMRTYDDDPRTEYDVLDAIADLLSATGAPAYIRVADDLRGVVREEGEAKQQAAYIAAYSRDMNQISFGEDDK